MKRKHGLPRIHQLPGGVFPQECPVGEPLTPSFHMGMEINKDQPKEKAKAIYSELAIARKPATITCVLVETQRHTVVWESSLVGKVQDPGLL